MTRLIASLMVSFILMQANFVSAQSFSNVTNNQGLSFINSSLDGFGTGVSFYDFNQDGWDDISFAKENGTQGIYLNNQGSFQTANFTLSNVGETKHLLWVDYDNDGVLDVFITTKNGRNYLYKNNGNFVFADVTLASGLSANSALNYGAAFGDYDKDGFLDLYVCKYVPLLGDSNNLTDVNNLYHNNGDGTFTDVTFSAGVSDGLKPSFCAVWFDYNNDTWPDLYVVNDRIPDASLYRNNANGTFTNVTIAANLTAPISNFMTGTIGDYNNDNDLDIFVSNTTTLSGQAPPMLFDNQGDGSFINLASQLGIFIPTTTWGGLWIDYDNNGWQDLYAATSFMGPNAPVVRSYFFRNMLPFGFEEDSTVFIGNHITSSHAVARGDFDNDGFYDIVVQNEAPKLPFLWHNSGNTNNFIKITLEGTVSNKFAIGSWIRVYAGGDQYNQFILCGENYLGQNSQHHIFGLGQAVIVDSVVIQFPSGIVNAYYNLNVNQDYYFVEGQQNNTFNILAIQDTIICEGDSILLSAPTFSAYLWNTGDTTQSIYVYDAGSYSLSTMDSLGLSYTSNIINIGFVSKPLIQSYLQNETCYEAQDAFIALVVVNEGQAYQILWENGLQSDTLSFLTAGNYNCTYTDTFLCSYDYEFELASPFPLNVQSQIELPSATQLGALSLSINGGTPPYEIFLDNEFVTNYIEDLDSGIYVLEILDAQNCPYQDTIVLAYWDTTTVGSLRSVGIKALWINPNPFLDFINLQFEMNENEIISCYLQDSKGSIIFETKIMTKIGTNQIQIQTPESLDSGVYYLIFQGQGSSKFQQLLKKE